MRIRALLVLTLALSAACSDDDRVHHLPDAPLAPDAGIDAGIDAAEDAPGGDDEVELEIMIAGDGGGTITSSPEGITCGAMCTSAFARDTIVTLTAVPQTGSVFGGWNGACTGSTPTCEVTLADAASAVATFTRATYTVTVVRAGAGTGTVSGDGIACGATCTRTVTHGTVMTLTATPGSLSTFAGWGGACSGANACAFTVTAPTSVTASFALDDVTLFVSRGGTGTGTVMSTPAGISCGADCEQTYAAGQATTLTATPEAGSTFAGWTGAGCSGTAPCTITMTAATTVTATFTLEMHALAVTRAGNGSGAITSTPGGIACGADCGELYNHGTSVTLAAAPSTGSTFTGWSGACTGTGACVVPMTAARSVTATFTLDTHALAVNRVGTGAGTVSGTGIACGADCSEVYNFGTQVMLTAAPATGSTFAGWSGACSGTGACVVTMTAARSVTATFALDQHTLTVSRSGIGTVSGNGISCGSDCTETVGHGTIITLSAAPGFGSSFAGWSGACTGTGGCSVTMDAAKSVTATFTLDSFLLSVGKSGAGSGTISGTGISCGGDCSELFTHGTTVTLSAFAATGSVFVGWSGACIGTGSCTVTMDAAKSAVATFTLAQHMLSVTRAGTGDGTVTGTGISCGSDCSEVFTHGTTVTLTASVATGSTFAGWGGACSGTGSCTVTMDAARSVTATFNVVNHTVQVFRGGTGTGTVTGNGINCGADCVESVPHGTVITLTATPSSANATASRFLGWSGSCAAASGTTCTVVVTSSTSVTASFALAPNLMFVTSSLFTGDLGGLAGADARCQNLAASANLPGTYRAYLSSLDGNTQITAPSRMGGASGWVRVDGAPVMNDIGQLAGGALFNAPRLTESGVDAGTSQLPFAWTGTTTSGTFDSTCSAATAFIPWGGTSGTAMAGDVTSTSSSAVALDVGDCGLTLRLYCLGVDRAAVAQ
ncbi:MAG: hypothetical protein H0T89_14435 [Deltaproteobacteria bacterium]|nr:hypothetical protein [Deltaproteobacteria bacterium]